MNSPYEAPSADLQGGGILRPCKGCGAEIHITAATCPHCGASQRSSRYKSKLAAALFALFLGGFGIHRFYLGQWWGIFYLLLFWTMIPGFVALVEFIVFLARNQEGWDAEYNDGIPQGPNEKGSGAVIALLIVFGAFFFIAIIGILAAIAIPAYAEYTHRAKVAGAVAQTLPAKQAILEFFDEHQVLPKSNVMAGLDEPLLIDGNHEIKIVPNGFELIFSSSSADIDSKTIVFVPFNMADGSVTWDCTTGTLDNRYRLADCRQ